MAGFHKKVLETKFWEKIVPRCKAAILTFVERKLVTSDRYVVLLPYVDTCGHSYGL